MITESMLYRDGCFFTDCALSPPKNRSQFDFHKQPFRPDFRGEGSWWKLAELVEVSPLSQVAYSFSKTKSVISFRK